MITPDGIMKFNSIVKAFSLSSLALFSLNSQAVSVDKSSQWQTFETENFRVHFTPEYRDWALSSAREMENVRLLIQKQQNRVLDEKVDAYIVDPLNASNGFAVPLSSKPYMALFATPPQSDSVISNSSSWQQLLVLHEYVHLVHLAQKNRSEWRNQLAQVWDLYDASIIKADRWVAEGYATLQESKLTGRGRLYHDGVEAIIQQFAREGALPTYSQLSKMDKRYMSGSMAYLVGVRYLKWLEENYGEDTLDAVWSRWKAVKQRSFNQSFEGVFQDSAQTLYKRFVAEYTFKAMSKEAQYADSNSELWLDLTGQVSEPSLSPNGNLLAVVETQRKEDHKEVILNIYTTQDNIKAAEKFNKKAKEILKDDPQDIIGKTPKVFKREIKFTLNQTNYQSIRNPRWLNDDTIIFGASTKGSDSQLHQDLFSWNINTGKTKQITQAANLRRFDITDDVIIAEQSRFGKSQLVKFDFNGNKISDLNKASTSNIYDFPRLNSDASQLAYLTTGLNNKWLLKVKDLNSSSHSDFVIPVPTNYQFLSYPEWSKDSNSLYYVAGTQGEVKMYQYHFKSKTLSAISSGEHPVSWPIAQNDDSLLHLSINSNGPDIYQLALKQQDFVQVTDIIKHNNIDIMAIDNSPIKLSPAQMTVDESIGQQRDYGIGPQEGTLSIGESFYSASTNLIELGYKSGDVLSRFDWQVNVSSGLNKNILSGASANVRWQGWPIKLFAHAYQYDLKVDEQKHALTDIPTDISETGILLEASYPFRRDTLSINTIAQVRLADTETNDVSADHHYQSFGFDQSWYFDKQVWGVSQKSKLNYISGELEDMNYDGYNAMFSLAGHVKHYGLGAEIQAIKRTDEASNIINIGGFGSTLMQPKAHLNTVFAPEMAFYSATTNDYVKYEVFSPFEAGRLFYTRHTMKDQDNIDVYGIKGEFTNDFGFTGISNLSINLGLAQVNPENSKSDLKAWLGLWHKW